MVDARQRLDAERLQAAFVNDHHPRGAITDLRRGGGGEAAVLHDQLDAANRLKAGIEADAFIDAVNMGGAIMGRHVDGDNLPVERPGFGGGRTTALAFIAKGIQRILRQIIFLGDHFGAGELAELDAGVTRLHARAAKGGAHAIVMAQLGSGAHRHAGHRFDTGGDDDIHLAAHHRCGSEMNCLLRGTTLPINAGAGD